MTNEEKAKEIGQKWYYDSGNTNDVAYRAAFQMAKWKEQQMIEKACKWLEYNFNMPNDFKEYFTKAMTEE